MVKLRPTEALLDALRALLSSPPSRSSSPTRAPPLLPQDLADELQAALAPPGASPCPPDVDPKEQRAPHEGTAAAAAAAATAPPSPPWVEHKLLAEVAKQLRSRGDDLRSLGLEPQTFTLHALLRGTEVYVPPRPVYIRPPELDRLLAEIQLSHDRASYASMLATSSAAPSLFSLRDKASGTGTGTGAGAAPPEVEAREWAETKKQLAALANILFSSWGVGVAVFSALGARWSVEARMGMGLGSGLVVAGAESFLYWRFFDKASKPSRSAKGRQEVGRTIDWDEVLAKQRAAMEETAKQEQKQEQAGKV